MSMNKTCPISSLTSDDVPEDISNRLALLDEQRAGDRVCDGEVINDAPSKLWEEPFWIHALLFATALAYEQTCFARFSLAPVSPRNPMSSVASFVRAAP